RSQPDIPEVALNIPPPLLYLLIDNATIREMRQLVGAEPVPVVATCKTTNEGMDTLFRNPRFFRRYGRKWNSKTAYIGGLHSAYVYCAAADCPLGQRDEPVGTGREGCRRTGTGTGTRRIRGDSRSSPRAGLLQGSWSPD